MAQRSHSRTRTGSSRSSSSRSRSTRSSSSARRRSNGRSQSSRASSSSRSSRGSSRKSKSGSRSAESRSRSAESRGRSTRPSRGESSRARASASTRGGGSRSRRTTSAAQSRPLTDHDEIRQWAEERDATPSCVRGTGGGEDVGMIRLDFPGYRGEGSLEPIEWDEWFQKFDESGLALLVQERTAGGERSNFNKLVRRETAESAGRRSSRSTSGGSRRKAA